MTVKSLTPITDTELLAKVKTDKKYSGTYHDAELLGKIAEIKLFLQDAGVSEDVVNSTLAVGCIARGVSDLVETQYGGGGLSEYFFQRADQLRGVVVENG